MDTMKALRKPIAIAFALALLTTACSSDQADEVVDDDSNTGEQVVDDDSTTAPVADDQPPEGFRRLTFTFTPEEVITDVYGGDLSTFEVRSASGDETVIVGFLDASGTIDDKRAGC